MGGQLHEDWTQRVASRSGSDREFGVVMGLALAAVAAWPMRTGGHVRVWVLAAGVAVLACGLVAPRALHPLNRLWSRLGVLLSRIVSPVVLAVLFYAVFTPYGLSMRLLGKDPLRLRRKPLSTYWIEREPPGPASGSFIHQF